MSVRLVGGDLGMERWAVMSSRSAKAKYRYALGRRWAPGPKLALLMLNGSTADHRKDDPTVRRGIGFAKTLECGTLEVANLYGLRSKDPSKLWIERDPIGLENDSWILKVCDGAEAILVAWGAHKKAKARADYVMDVLLSGRRLLCLRQTKEGFPEHPLYIPSAQRPTTYREGLPCPV
jgi:hypothetical protein